MDGEGCEERREREEVVAIRVCRGWVIFEV